MDQQIAETQQTQTPIVDADIASDEPTTADLIAASQAAGGAESVDVEAEAAAAGTPPPAKVEPVAESSEPKIAAVLRAREEAFAKRQEATDYAAQLRAEAEREAEQIRASARKQAAADYEADLAARRQKFRDTPGAAIRELGTTDEVVDAVTREGTPEWKAMRQLQKELAETQASAAEGKKAREDFEAYKAQQVQREQVAALREVERHFLTTVATPEATPYLHKRYDPEEILAKAHAQASAWTKAGIPFAHSDVAEYLEHQARQRLAGVPVPPQQVSGGGSAQKVRANGSRTLSAATGSERRASPKPLEEMSPDEERNALIEAVAEARRASGS